MSAITKIFAPNLMNAMSLEAKGSKESRESRGSRPETKRKLEPKNRNTPGTVLPKVYGPIPEDRKPNIMYIDPSSSVSTMDADKTLASNSVSAEQSAAVKTVMSWKNPSIYKAYAEKARGSSSSGKSGPITYDVVKSEAVGSSSDRGFKSTAVYSTGS